MATGLRRVVHNGCNISIEAVLIEESTNLSADRYDLRTRLRDQFDFLSEESNPSRVASTTIDVRFRNGHRTF